MTADIVRADKLGCGTSLHTLDTGESVPSARTCEFALRRVQLPGQLVIATVYCRFTTRNPSVTVLDTHGRAHVGYHALVANVRNKLFSVRNRRPVRGDQVWSFRAKLLRGIASQEDKCVTQRTRQKLENRRF